MHCARVGFAGERLALNILQRMSGIATATRRLVALIPASSKTKYTPSNTIKFWSVFISGRTNSAALVLS
jgi:hypothetical protein